MALEREWNWVHSDRWHFLAESTPDEDFVIVATDASNEGWGVEIITLNGSSIWSSGYQPWPECRPKTGQPFEPCRADHIFLKEMFAAAKGLEICDQKIGCKGIHLVIDNTAVAGAVRRGYSTNTLGNEMLERISRCSHRKRLVHSVTSEDNAADSASRNLPLDAKRVERTTLNVKEALKGNLIGVAKRHPNLNRDDSGIRHTEGLEDDIELDEVPPQCMVQPPDIAQALSQKSRVERPRPPRERVAQSTLPLRLFSGHL